MDKRDVLIWLLSKSIEAGESMIDKVLIPAPNGNKYEVVFGYAMQFINIWVNGTDRLIDDVNSLEELMDKLAVEVAPFDEAGMQIWKQVLELEEWV